MAQRLVVRPNGLFAYHCRHIMEQNDHCHHFQNIMWSDTPRTHTALHTHLCKEKGPPNRLSCLLHREDRGLATTPITATGQVNKMSYSQQETEGGFGFLLGQELFLNCFLRTISGYVSSTMSPDKCWWSSWVPILDLASGCIENTDILTVWTGFI